MSLFSPWGLIALITVPVIIALYLLKQKHEDKNISSLYLWSEVLKDIEANAPWQKLRKNILMVLQIIAMVLLAFALAKPFLNVGGQDKNTVVLIMDTSLSMQAEDVKPTRFDASKKQAVEFVSNLKPGTKITLISMGNDAVIEENLTTAKTKIIDKIQSMKVSNGSADYENAQSIVRSIVSADSDASVIHFGDREFGMAGIKVQNINFSKNGDNYAVTIVSHRENSDSITVLSAIANYSTEDTEVPVTLYADGVVLDAKNVFIKSGETANVYWDNVPKNIELIECRIDLNDSLNADNSGFDAVNPQKINKVLLISNKNVFIEKVASLLNGIEFFKTTHEEFEEIEGYDLYIFDGFLPEKLPEDGNIMVFNPPANNYFEVADMLELPDIKKSNHEVFKYLEDFSFTIGRTKTFNMPLWAEPVLESEQGTIMFAGNLEGRRVLVSGFDIHDTDMPLTPSFPIFVSSSFEYLMPSRIKNVEALLPGDAVEFNLNPGAREVRVITPSGNIVKLAPPFPAGFFKETADIGKYVLEQTLDSGETSHYFTVNPPSRQESDLRVRVANVEGSGEVVNANETDINTGKNLRSILLWLILLVAVIEWFIYTKGI